MTISSTTLGLLLDAGLSNGTLKAIAAAIEADVEKACNALRVTLREQVTLSDAGSVTPAALRMRKMRENKRLLAEMMGENSDVTDGNTVTSPSVTSDNSSLEVKGFEEGSKEVVTARDKKKISYSEPFQKFWTDFPTDKLMSKAEAFMAWKRLSLEDQELALAAIPEFKKHIATLGTTYRTVHAVRYLSQRRFDGFRAELEQPAQNLNSWETHPGTPEWDAWEPYWIKTKGHKPPRNIRGSWAFPSQWPPGYEHDLTIPEQLRRPKPQQEQAT